MAQSYYDSDADLSLIQGKKVAIIGYGSQGHAHALNLRDSGVTVKVGLRSTSKSRAKAEAKNLEVGPVPEVAEWADTIMILAPDPAQPRLYREQIAPHLSKGKTLMFGHGFNIRYESIVPPENVDVSMVAPKSPGHRVRETYLSGEGTPGLVAVHQDSTGQALANALSYAKGLGCTRAGVIETTFAEETETDLFGEQAVLCGGVTALIKAGFETLVEAGYQPEIAYFECLHELKLIVDLFYEGGIANMWYSVSNTAEYGGLTRGPRVVTEETKQEMKRILEEIQTGRFVREFVTENQASAPSIKAMRRISQAHQIEEVGERLRAMMPWIQERRLVDRDKN